jgi:UDP-galactose transporter B1
MCKETKLGSPSILTKHKSALTLLFVASGICFSYWFYGFLQEKLLTKSRLGATFILVIQTVANLAVAKVWQGIETPPGKTDTTMRLNHPLLFLTSACYVFAMVGSNESLRFVSYPVAVLAKSCKLIPTMVMGRLIERRQYSTQQWMAAICISSGIALFNYSRMSHNQSQQPSSSSEEDKHYWKGMVLLCISLSMDGFLGACQGMLKRPGIGPIEKRQRPPTAVETMLFINVYALFLLFPLAVVTDQWNEGIRLLKESEQLRVNIAILTGVVSVGQIFIFLCIAWYSSLVTTTITTTRKFFTILLSVLHFGHSFTVGQWTSVCMVFGGLYLSIASGSRPNVDKSIPEGKKIN